MTIISLTPTRGARDGSGLFSSSVEGSTLHRSSQRTRTQGGPNPNGCVFSVFNTVFVQTKTAINERSFGSVVAANPVRPMDCAGRAKRRRRFGLSAVPQRRRDAEN
jgi:hypothetical protein